MWSGNITGQGESYPTQWALNPSAQYLHMPQEQVDWASLAQQWIKMKEEAPQMEKEQGEAPMEITKDDSVSTPAPTAVPNPPAWPTTQIPSGSDAASWWGWGQTGTPTNWAMTAPYTSIPAADTTVTQTTPSYPFTPAAPAAPDTYVPPPPTAYWGTEVRVHAGKEETPSWDSNKNNKKPIVDTVTEIDAAKRKQLPAWIREGLEKMEREKMKKAESERLERERKEALLKKALEEPETPSTTVNIDGNGYEEPPKSKFESESSDEEADEKEKLIEEAKPRKSRFDVRQATPPKLIFRTKEQILQDVMGDVRKILTQILMEVTSEEIEKAVEDASRYFRKKAPATTVRKTQALTSLTGKLGLGIYESDSESEDSSDEKVTNDPDSDLEIKERIERLKNDFVLTERHIEREVIEQEEREKRQLLKEKRDSSEEKEGQVLTQQLPGASKEKQIEYKSQQFEDHHRHREMSNAPRGDSVSKVTASPREKHAPMTKELSSSSSSNTGGSSSRSSVTRKSERSRKRSSSSSSSTSSSSSSSDRRPRRSRSRERMRSDRRPHKRRRHHSRHRRRSSSSSSSPPRRHHHRHRR